VIQQKEEKEGEEDETSSMSITQQLDSLWLEMLKTS